MSDLSDLPCAVCGAPLERVRYFPRQMLTADDMRLEQEYFREKLRRHNRYLHGWGVVCGLAVEWTDDLKNWSVRVCPGYAVAPQGDEIAVDDCVIVDLKLGATPEPCTVRWPCPPVGEMPGGDRERPAIAYIAVRYAECHTRPVRVHPGGCGCDEVSCEYARVRESFEAKVLWKLPQSHRDALTDDHAWCQALRQPSTLTDIRRRHRFPAPACPACVTEPWVVIATVIFPAKEAPSEQFKNANPPHYNDRRVLLATQRLQTAVACLE
jgi:hypothetical protein